MKLHFEFSLYAREIKLARINNRMERNVEINRDFDAD